MRFPIGKGIESPSAGEPEEWEATRAQTALATQILRHDADDAGAQGGPGIGRPTGNNRHELFVSCSPTEAMRQQFEHARSEFIAVHDIATASSVRLLTGLATACNGAVQRLLIRRQGGGATLATLEFVDVPRPDGSSLRIYSTLADADTVSRHGLAQMLLSHSRIGVLMFGDLPAHALTAALLPFRAAIRDLNWRNRELLLLPLGADSGLQREAADLSHGTAVLIRATPRVVRPSEAWEHINASLEGTFVAATPGTEPGGTAATSGAPPIERRAARQPVPRRSGAGAPPGPDARSMRRPAETANDDAAVRTSQMAHHVSDVMALTGVSSCVVFDVASGLEVAQGGNSPLPAELAMHGKALLASMSSSSRVLGMGHVMPEASITLESHHLLLRGIAGSPGMAMHVAIKKAEANLTLVRLQIERLVPPVAGTRQAQQQ